MSRPITDLLIGCALAAAPPPSPAHAASASSEGFVRVIATEIDKWGRVAREAGIRAE